MVVTLGIIIGLITLLVSFFILGVGVWNLYFSHYREGRSEIKVLSEDSDTVPEFRGGNNAIDQGSFWTGHFYLKIVNAGENGAYVASISHSLEGLKKSDQISDPENVSLEIRDSTGGWAGKEIEPGSSKRYRVSVKISTDSDIGVLVNHDSTIIQHTFEVEDNKGSYEVNHTTEMKLTGPEAAIENWEDHQHQNS